MSLVDLLKPCLPTRARLDACGAWIEEHSRAAARATSCSYRIAFALASSLSLEIHTSIQ